MSASALIWFYSKEIPPGGWIFWTAISIDGLLMLPHLLHDLLRAAIWVMERL